MLDKMPKLGITSRGHAFDYKTPPSPGELNYFRINTVKSAQTLLAADRRQIRINRPPQAIKNILSGPNIITDCLLDIKLLDSYLDQPENIKSLKRGGFELRADEAYNKENFWQAILGRLVKFEDEPGVFENKYADKAQIVRQALVHLRDGEIEQFNNLKQTKLQNITLDLSGVDFSEKDLGGADFSNANLERANIRGSNIKDTDFKGANLHHLIVAGYNKMEITLYQSRNIDWQIYELVQSVSIYDEGATITCGDWKLSNITRVNRIK